MAETKKVAVIIYPGVELVDMNGPIDALLKANRENNNRYQVFTVAESDGAIKSERAAVDILPQYTLSSCPEPDIIILPGQIMPGGSTPPFGVGSEALIEWLREKAENKDTVFMSVCVGAYILARTGLLATRRATTHWEALDDIQQEYPDITFVKNVRYVADENFITTGGVTSGIDGALYLISMLDGADTAQTVADVMVYNRDAPLPPNTILP